MNSEAFLSLYLKEIGVQAPISSFLSVKNIDQSIKSEARVPVAPSDINHQYEQVEKAAVERMADAYMDEDASIDLLKPSESVQPESFAAELAEPELTTYNQVEPTEVAMPQVGALLAQAEQVVVKESSAVVEPELQQEAVTEVVAPVDSLDALQVQAEACKACDLFSSRNQLVFGGGNPHADLVFIGDAPGRDEDLIGSPFVGRSGELFDRMLASIALSRDDVYLMNGVKCMPEHSRDPKPIEFASCERWLVSQLEMIQPRLICLLGRVVAQVLLKNDLPLKALREGQFSFRGIPVLVIDHPSYLLRSQKHKQRAWHDLNRLQSQLSK